MDFEGVRYLLEVIGLMLFTYLYTWFIVMMCFVYPLGVFTYLLIFALFSPFLTLWYYVLKKREENYLALLRSSRVWDVKESVEKYVNSLKEDKEDT